LIGQDCAVTEEESGILHFYVFQKLNTDVQAEVEFKASTGWLSNFKSRKCLVSRRQTSCRSLPENTDDICCRFIQEVHNIIEKKVFRSRTLSMWTKYPDISKLSQSQQ
jgi:hypothetical protein